MDHLPYPGSATGMKRTIVPYICQEDYDGEEFLTYPNRKWNLPTLHLDGFFPNRLMLSHQTQLASLSTHDIGSFYQTWLFFGLIHEILGSICVPEDIIYMCEDHCGYTKAVSTSKVIPALEEWVARVRTGKVEPSVTYAHIAECLCLTHAALSIQAVRSHFDPNIQLSLASLGQTFTYAANAAFGITDIKKDSKCPSTWCMLIDNGYWKERLLAHGWCMTEVKLMLDNAMSLQTLHFIANLDKTDAGQNHQACDTQQCMIYQNNLGTYRTQHINKNCDCPELVIDQEALYTILRTRALPLIRVRPSETLEALAVDVVASQPSSRYVALSHVWADGLGNPYANALPRCQLLNIGKLIQGLDMDFRARDIRDDHVTERDSRETKKELLLWCDTLCCPVQPKVAKDLALEYMHQTYQDATYVLVLDSSLRHCDINKLGIDEVSMRILTSPWMRRLWTLQEGALPSVTNKLWFQLAHKALNIRQLRINANKKFLSTISRKGLAGDMINRLSSFATVFMKNGTMRAEADLENVINALCYRSVSIPSDEPLLIGNLLGIDIAQILDGDDGTAELRMNRLWRVMASASLGIPSSLLFRVGPRLAEPGLKWAPATFLIDYDANIGIQSSQSENEGILTASDGLLVQLHGFRLSLASCAKGLPSRAKDISQLDRPNRIFMIDSGGLWYMMRRILPVEQDSFLTDKTLAELVLECENLWVIYPGPEFPRQSDNKLSTSVGLIVEAKRNEGAEVGVEDQAVKKTRAKVHIYISPLQASAQAWFAAATTLSAQLASNSPTLRKLRAEEEDLEEPDPSSSRMKLALEDLASEIHRTAANKEAKETIEAARNTFSVSEMEELITMIIWGQYVCMGETVSRNQRWCVD